MGLTMPKKSRPTYGGADFSDSDMRLRGLRIAHPRYKGLTKALIRYCARQISEEMEDLTPKQQRRLFGEYYGGENRRHVPYFPNGWKLADYGREMMTLSKTLGRGLRAEPLGRKDREAVKRAMNETVNRLGKFYDKDVVRHWHSAIKAADRKIQKAVRDNCPQANEILDNGWIISEPIANRANDFSNVEGWADMRHNFLVASGFSSRPLRKKKDPAEPMLKTVYPLRVDIYGVRSNPDRVLLDTAKSRGLFPEDTQEVRL